MAQFAKFLYGLFFTAVVLAIWGFVIEPSLLIERDMLVTHWPGPPLRIAFFSDLHAGSPHINVAYIKDLVSRINQTKPDLILIGGDLVINNVPGGEFMPIEQVAPLLKELKAPLGVYAVLGNHDWWNDGPRILITLEENGIDVLENQTKRIQISEQFAFWLVGIGDEYTQHADPRFALSQVNTPEPRILFMHDPASLFHIKEKFFLSLAGHLHGGQIYVPGIGALVTPGKAPTEWAKGWVDFELGSLFVSRGVGTSIIPVRINALPEYVVLDLKGP